MERILLIGKSGMLGQALFQKLKEHKDYHIYAPSSKELNICFFEDLVKKVTNFRPSIIINCAAYTDVDASETNDAFVEQVNRTSCFLSC